MGTSKNLLRAAIFVLRCSPYLRTAALLERNLRRSLRFFEAPECLYFTVTSRSVTEMVRPPATIVALEPLNVTLGLAVVQSLRSTEMIRPLVAAVVKANLFQ